MFRSLKQGPKHDDIKGLLCLTVIYMTLLSKHNGVDSIKIIRHVV